VGTCSFTFCGVEVFLEARFLAAAAVSAAFLAACSGGGSTIVPSNNTDNGPQAQPADREFTTLSTFTAPRGRPERRQLPDPAAVEQRQQRLRPELP
jgi:hypothetical protein